MKVLAACQVCHEIGYTLDLCNSIISGKYFAVPLAPLRFSDYAVAYFLPSYRQKLKGVKSCVRNIKRWDYESILRLQGCLACTDWDSFKHAYRDIHEYADNVTSYISFCQNVCNPKSTLIVFGNDKPWFTRNMKIKMKQNEEAFKSGDDAQYKNAKYDVKRARRAAKTDYRPVPVKRYQRCLAGPPFTVQEHEVRKPFKQ